MFETTQELMRDDCIASGHDISDGGILACISEMAFAGTPAQKQNPVGRVLPLGNCGVKIGFSSNGHEALSLLFAEELGCVLEVDPETKQTVLDRYQAAGVACTEIGKVTSDKRISIDIDGIAVLDQDMTILRDVWESTSFELERLQCAHRCVEEEQSSLKHLQPPEWHLTFSPESTPPRYLSSNQKPSVAVVRAEGSNGDREMAAAIYAAGMQPWDVTMDDLLTEKMTLDVFSGLVFVGGFSFADVLDSAKGWSGTILFNDRLLDQFRRFYDRPETFSLGVCNGCQLMALLGVVGRERPLELDLTEQPRFVHNTSGRFESRWTTVRIEKSPCMWLSEMEGSVMGIWCAHGEGRAYFPDPVIESSILDNGLAPIRYCDAEGEVTMTYPSNPNGSPWGIAAMCSKNGRHLAMMPHPERCFMTWQLPWYPTHTELSPKGPGPWLKLFQNARNWHEGVDP